MPAIKY